MGEFPRSLLEFQRQFPDEAACAAYLSTQRWPEGFVCPVCDSKRGWALETKPWTTECADCGRQTSVTAGTVMHGSRLPLTVWFWAAYLMATHSNGISATQIRSQLGLGSYKTAWLLCAKLRSAMVNPERTPLTGIVEMDETGIPFRTRNDPPAGGQGRSHRGKMLVAGAVEIVDGGPGRIRLQAISDFSGETLRGVVKETVAPGSTLKTDGWTGYAASVDVAHDPHVIGPMAAHIVLPWVHRVFSNLKTWALGVYHGLRRKHLQSYLNEFVFRFNRRRTRHAAFRSLLGLVTTKEPITYNMLIAPKTKG